ncbi:unnamed protein product [Calypogeia fissa]
MGTFTGHVVPAFFFCVLGLWHLISASVTYLRFPREYCARAWQPLPFVTGRLRSLELYILLVAIPFGIFYEIGISTGFHPLENGVIPLYRIATFQHSIVLVMFWVFALLALVSETTQILPLPVEIPFVLLGISFLMEFNIVADEAAQNSGLEGKLYLCLLLIIGSCAVCSFLLAWNPRTFYLDFLFGMTLILHGTWLFQIGFSLYVEKFIPEGCHRLLDLPGGVNGSTQCDLDDVKVRAMELMGFALNCHVVSVVLFSVLTLGVVARVLGYRQGGYDPLNYEQDNDMLQMKPMPKLNTDKD